MSLLKESKSSLFNPQPMDAAAGGPLVSSSTTSFAGISSPIPTPPGDRPTRVITTKPQTAISDQELRARLHWSTKKSAHFQLSFDRLAFADPQTDTLLEALETAYRKILAATRETFDGTLQVYILDHRAPALQGRSVRSHFNIEENAIYLVQTSSQHLFAELVRLVSHGMRGDRYRRHFGQTEGWSMMQEGFSIFLNYRLSPFSDVFPFYGADAEVIAHHLYQKHSCSLLNSWRTHTPSIEHTVLSGAFLLYLGDTFSDDRVIRFSKADDAVSSSNFADAFGAPLEELEMKWTAHLPSSLICHTQDEQSEMIFHWEQSIECKRH